MKHNLFAHMHMMKQEIYLEFFNNVKKKKDFFSFLESLETGQLAMENGINAIIRLHHKTNFTTHTL